MDSDLFFSVSVRMAFDNFVQFYIADIGSHAGSKTRLERN